MTSIVKEDKHVPSEGGGKGGKLARRARSFKEDFLDILSQMRSPGGGSPKPRSPKARTSSSSDSAPNDDRDPLADLQLHVKQVQFALKHFRDVVSRNKLEVLPGNGTIVLESIATIHGVLNSYIFIDQSSTLVSATNQVYQSLACLIKLCDDVLLCGEKALNKQNVTQVLEQVDDAVQNLVGVASAKMSEKSSGGNRGLPERRSDPTLSAPTRSSLPDIPLTPRERQILEQTSNAVVLSQDSVVQPPPKPPLPTTRVWVGESPPPLPPKRKGGGSYSAERLSLRSDTSSLTSSDSMLNTSSHDDEDDDNKAGGELSSPPDHASVLAHGINSLMNGSHTSSCCWDSSCSNVSDRTQSPEPLPTSLTNNLTGVGSEWPSSSSGFMSMRSSSQSYSYSSSKSSTVSVHQSGLTESSKHQSNTVVQQSSVLQQNSVVQQSSVVQQNTVVHQNSVVHQNCSVQQNSAIQQNNIVQQNNLVQQSSLVHQDSLVLQNTSGISEVDGSERPPLPAKKRSIREREVSQYDNVNLDSVESSKPPPLPIKKKHIMAYMEMFGNCSPSNSNDYMRHSVYSYSALQQEWQQQQASISSAQSYSFSLHHSLSMREEGAPPALPPKRSRPLTARGISLGGVGGLPASPIPIPPRHRSPVAAPPTPPPPLSPLTQAENRKVEVEGLVVAPNGPRLSPLGSSTPVSLGGSTLGSTTPVSLGGTSLGGASLGALTPVTPVEALTPAAIPSPLFESDITQYLVLKKPEEEGPEIRGGHPDALVVHATKASKNDFLYQEAFLTTYRTFLTPLELIEKLCMRHQRFSPSADVSRQRAARESFSLLVRVVSDLTISDLDQAVLQMLMDFVYQLLYKGDLTMAKALRVKILEKYAARQMNIGSNSPLSAQNVSTRQSSLLDFKSDQVAEQMTLLDSELFMKIEIPEVLIWAQEQNEERSANLTRFTEHFNKMSYWARSRILEKDDAKERERYVVKFIKIMKHLRKINNFNSYLALLSALDSAPIRRLEWQKHITEGLKEYCALIDSSSSFRAYRQALAETNPPCIPYIGLVLQDLTFVHIGNSDYLSDNVINFSKRWQQFNIVENMKRFKKGTYSFKKNERIISFFDNFDNHLCEEAMWQLSEKIKPRGTKKLAA